MTNAEFNKWIREGLEKGYLKELDVQFRKQYGIEEQCKPLHWEDAKKHFAKDEQ